MDKEQKLFLLALAVFIFVVFIWVIVPILAYSEGSDETTAVYVTAKLLNGRAEPSKKSTVEARFDKGDQLDAFWWSDDHQWIQVIGGETGTVWVWWEYVTERVDEFLVWNDYGTKIKIRNKPYGRVTGYLKKDGELYIDKVVLGWGHSDRGWVDLRYLTEED